MIRPVLLGSVLGLSCLSSMAAPTPSDFAYHQDIVSRSDAPIYVIAVPETVYRFGYDRHLGDIRIFNSDSEIAPHALWQTDPPLLPSAHEWTWLEVLDTAPESDNVFEYDAEGHFPIDTVIIDFAETNTLTGISLQSRAQADVEWETRFQGPAYSLNSNGFPLESGPIQLPIKAHRFWRLELDNPRSVLHHRSPKLRVAWQPDLIVFVARGRGPFLLAYGSSSVTLDQSTSREVISALREEGLASVVRSAEVDQRVQIGDESLLNPVVPVDWRKGSLWTALAVCVIFLLGLSLRLWRQLSGANPQRQ